MTQHVTNNSLKKRFMFKLLVNFISVFLGLIVILFIPRILGPENFGRFEFVTNNFKLIMEMLALQVPIAYFNWVSRKGHKQNTDLATSFTLYFSVLITFVFALFILTVVLFKFNYVLWPEISPRYLMMAFLFVVITFFNQFFIYLADAKALTVGLEKIRLFQNFIKTVILLALALLGLLTLKSYFVAQIIVVLLATIILFLWLEKKKSFETKIFKIWAFSKEEVNKYYWFVKSYVRPLIILMVSSFLFLYFDRWFLQLIGGSVQQGYFGLSDRLGSLAFIFTSAMTPLITREFAHAYEENDIQRTRYLFNRIKIFLFIATVTGCFLSIQSKNVIGIVGGNAFKNAFIPISIMALYPIHQTFGQLSAALLLATGRTKIYSNIGISTMLLSLPFTYILLAPKDYLIPGLNLGATGLAIKMVILQVIATNIQLYFNMKYLKQSFLKWIWFQIVSITVLFAGSFVSSILAGMLIRSFGTLSILNIWSINQDIYGSIVKLILSGSLYLIVVVSLVMFFPSIIGCKREELKDIFKKIKTKYLKQS